PLSSVTHEDSHCVTFDHVSFDHHPPSSASLPACAPSSVSPPNPVVCQVCGRGFESEQGLRSHLPSHPIEANTARLRARHLPPPIDQQTDASSPANQSDSLSAQCEQWRKQFERLLNNPNEFTPAIFDSLFDSFTRFLFEANE